MVSKGNPSKRSAVRPLSDAQVARLAREHELVDPTRPPQLEYRRMNTAEIQEQNPKATSRLLAATTWVLRSRAKLHAWGLEHIPEEGVYIMASTHVSMFDVFVPMSTQFLLGRRPRYMAKAELATWPILGRWFRCVGMQSVPRRTGQAKAIEAESINIITDGRPLAIWPEGTLTRDPLKWPMSMKPGVGIIALESSRRLGYQVPILCAVVWGAASINHWWPWPKKNIVMCIDAQLDYSDLLEKADSWGEEVPIKVAAELATRIRERMEVIMAEIRGEDLPPEGYWDYKTMTRKPRRTTSVMGYNTL